MPCSNHQLQEFLYKVDDDRLKHATLIYNMKYTVSDILYYPRWSQESQFWWWDTYFFFYFGIIGKE